MTQQVNQGRKPKLLLCRRATVKKDLRELDCSRASGFGGSKYEREKGEETKEAAKERKRQGWG